MNRGEENRSGASRIFSPILALVLRVVASSWRVRGAPLVRREIERLSDRPLLIGFWHGKYFPLFGILSGTPAQVFVGAGPRGDIIAGICESFGFTPILLPHRDRTRAIEIMYSALAGAQPCASAIDGALGPARSVKPALLRIASDCGATILPISMSARPRWVLGWRWDQREIPPPFASIALHVGQPIEVPHGLRDSDIGHWSERLRCALDELDRRSPERSPSSFTA